MFGRWGWRISLLNLDQPLRNTVGAQIEFHQVSLQAPVGLNLILKDLSFTVEKGSLVVLVGVSGAGKTSLLRLLNRLVDPSQGRILWEGQDLKTLPVIRLRQQMALVLQESKLLGMTVEEALCYPNQLRGQSLAEAKRAMQPWLASFSIPNDWLGRREVELSLGQRQRVAIARALVTDPQVLLLDEPTAAQDIGYATQLLQQLVTLSQTQGMTVIMANHQLDLLQSIATQVLHLHQGTLLSNTPATQVNWQALRQKIIEANEQTLDEWEDK
jgi:D-methionine transport system ATP-binding protein